MHTGRRIFYRFRNFGLPANKITFSPRGDNEQTEGAAAVEQISVADFFTKKYRKLQHPHLPCINAIKGTQNQPNWLPMEVVRVSLSVLNKLDGTRVETRLRNAVRSKRECRLARK